MAPTTRSSSVQSSPASKLNSATHTPNTTPSRKPPCCRTCNQPMKGHPKSGCFNATSNSAKAVNPEDDEEEQPLTSVFKSMKLSSPKSALVHQGEQENKAFIRERRRHSATAALASSDTLLSLSASSNEILGQLGQAGTLGKSEDDKYVSKILHWQGGLGMIPKKSVTRGQHVMPGTLIPPTPDASFSITGDVEHPQPSKKVRIVTPSEEDMSTTMPGHPTQPLTRSMSTMERESFMSNLTKQAAATIYVVPTEDAEGLQTRAANLKYSTHLVNHDDAQALLILGRDESSVIALARQIDEDNAAAQNKEDGRSQSSRNSNFKAVAGAAVAGAVGTWAGLAFS